MARLFAKDAFEQLHYWQPKTKKEKISKAFAHAKVVESSARIAGNPAESGFYAGFSNEALIGEIQKIAKSNPAVAQWLSASLGALVNHGLGKSQIIGATEAQNATKNNAYGVMKKNTELEPWDYYIIDLYGNVYKRTNTDDSLVSPSVVRNGIVTTVVKQNPAKGYQSDGQEVFVYPDGPYVNIDEPLGKVHVG